MPSFLADSTSSALQSVQQHVQLTIFSWNPFSITFVAVLGAGILTTVVLFGTCCSHCLKRNGPRHYVKPYGWLCNSCQTKVGFRS